MLFPAWAVTVPEALGKNRERLGARRHKYLRAVFAVLRANSLHPPFLRCLVRQLRVLTRLKGGPHGWGGVLPAAQPRPQPVQPREAERKLSSSRTALNGPRATRATASAASPLPAPPLPPPRAVAATLDFRHVRVRRRGRRDRGAVWGFGAARARHPAAGWRAGC